MISSAIFLDSATLGAALPEAHGLDLSPLTKTVPHFELNALTAPDEVIAAAKDKEVIVTNKVKLDKATLAALPNLKLIAVAATGTDHVDLEAARAQKITVCNVPAYSTNAVAQLTFTLMLNLATQVPRYHQDVVAGQWAKSPMFCLLDHQITELVGKTLGLIGFGQIAKAVGKLAEAFGMQVQVAERPESEQLRPGRVPFDQVLQNADVVSLHCPLTPKTHHLMNSARFALMKPTAFLINTARGGVIDSVALYHALVNKQIAGAGVDVLETEPPPLSHPLLEAPLPNLIITPHIAWASFEARQRLVESLSQIVTNFCQGTVINKVV